MRFQIQINQNTSIYNPQFPPQQYLVWSIIQRHANTIKIWKNLRMSKHPIQVESNPLHIIWFLHISVLNSSVHGILGFKLIDIIDQTWFLSSSIYKRTWSREISFRDLAFSRNYGMLAEIQCFCISRCI